MKPQPPNFAIPGEQLEPCHDCRGDGCETCMDVGWLYVGMPESPVRPAPDETAVRIVSARCSDCGYINESPNPRPYAPAALRQTIYHTPNNCRGIMLFETVPA